MKLFVSLCVAATLLVVSASGQKVADRVEKSIVNYLGTNYLLHDGCPLPGCPASDDGCQRVHNIVRSLYSHCLQGEKGQYTGCITDRIGPSGRITLPVYASLCSAMCYEADPDNLERVHRCPHKGYRQHNPELQHLF